MNDLSEAQRAVLATARRELDRIGAEQQQLADDLSAALGGALPDSLMCRMQAFDLLRQRLDGLGLALAVLAETPSPDLAAAVPAALPLDLQRRVFAEALGVTEEAAAEAGEEIELF